MPPLPPWIGLEPDPESYAEPLVYVKPSERPAMRVEIEQEVAEILDY